MMLKVASEISPFFVMVALSQRSSKTMLNESETVVLPLDSYDKGMLAVNVTVTVLAPK